MLKSYAALVVDPINEKVNTVHAKAIISNTPPPSKFVLSSIDVDSKVDEKAFANLSVVKEEA